MDPANPSTLAPFVTARRGPLVTRERRPTRPSALVLGLHGRGSLPQRLEPFAPGGLSDAHHVLPRGPFSFEGQAAWYLGRPAPLAELARSVTALEEVLETLWAEGRTPERTVLWGFSQGAMVALQLALLSRRPFAGVVGIGAKLHASATDDLPLLARAQGRRFLLIHGRADRTIPPEQGEAACRQLRAAGADCRWEETPGGHALDPEIARHLEGFAREVLGD